MSDVVLIWYGFLGNRDGTRTSGSCVFMGWSGLKGVQG